MSLSSYRFGAAVVAVSDMNRAKDFNEGGLGLTPWGDDPDGGRTCQCGDQTALHVFPPVAPEGSRRISPPGLWTISTQSSTS
jgi:hypothetical protein